MSLRYKGIDIDVNDQGVFSVQDNEDFEGLSDETFDGLKKKIDAAGAKKKMRLPAFTLQNDSWNSGGPSIEFCVVTSVVRDSSRTEAWIRNGKDGKGSRSKISGTSVYEVTDRNMAVAKKWLEHAKASWVANKKADQLSETLRSISQSHPAEPRS